MPIGLNPVRILRKIQLKELKMCSPKTSLVLFSFLMLSAFLSARAEFNIPIAKIKLTENILLFKTGATGVYPNMIAVKTGKGTVVFDSHQFPEITKKIRSLIEKEFGKNIVYLINTHGANDHTSGNGVFSDVPIIAVEEAMTDMRQWNEFIKNPQAAQRGLAGLQQMPKLRETYPGDPKDIDEEIERTTKTIADMKTAPDPATPTIMFHDQMTLDLGGRTFFLYHNTPSYSRSDIVIHIPEENVLIVGDIFNQNRLPWLDEKTDFTAMKNLFAPFIADDSKIKTFIGTHNGPMTIDEVRDNFRYIDHLRAEVARLRQEGKSLSDAVNELALTGFPVFSKFNPFFYGNPFNIHTINIQAVWKQLDSTKK
jgi:glyoxylase-like metal-dependent hydrolase (beta-lactamase superfamily II)